MRALRIVLLALTGWLLLAMPVQADPVSIAVFVTTSLPFISAAVDTFVFFAVQAAVYAGYTWAASKLASAGMKPQSGQERQASVTQLQIGESDREAIIGECATAGQLIDAFNYGGKYGTDWEVLVIALADHRCEALSGFYIGDAYYAFGGNGLQADFNSQLEIHWHDGQADQTADDLLTSYSGRWTSADRLSGVAYVVVAYKADDPKATAPIWSTGRPNFLWLVKGARLYDPRKDSTIDGGSGVHRWNDPSTWEWSDNAALARYAYVRGFYVGDQVSTPSALMIGRGLSEQESPGARIIAAANICDELVALKAGGSEKRYRANGVLRAGEPFIAIEEMFAASMAGIIVQRDGGVEIEPGVAKSAVATITDGDLIIGEPIHLDSFISQNDRVNTVTPRFTDPAQIWRDTAAPVRRSSADIIADGGLYERSISLSMVTTHTQAQRCGEIERRLARKEHRGSIVLGPRFSYLEDGDWISWQSDRYFGGETKTFRVEAINIGADYRTSLVMREISASVYAWTASADEGTPGQAPVDESGSLDALSLDDVSIVALSLSGDETTVIPAVQASWATPVDAGVLAVRLELKQGPSGDMVTLTQTVPQLGQMIVSNGVPAATSLQVRVVPVGIEGRQTVASSWVNLVTPGLMATGVTTIGGRTPAQLVADLAYVTAQGKKLIQAMLENFNRQLEDTGAILKHTLVDGQPMRSVLLNEISQRQDGDSLIVDKLDLIGAVSGDGLAFVLNEATVKVSATETLAEYKSAVTAQFSAASAGITAEATARASADSAFASSLSSVIAQVNSNTAAIATEITARVSADSALASNLTTISTAVGGHTATLSTYGESIDGLSAQWVLALDVNGKVSGIKAASSSTVSSLAFVADQIGFANLAGSSYFPLAIVGGEVVATNFRVDKVQANSIVTGSIVGGAVTTISTSSSAPASTVNTSPSTVHTHSHSSSGGQHVIHATFSVAQTSSGVSGVTAKIIYGGSEIGRVNIAFAGPFTQSMSIVLLHTPGAGTATYSVEMTQTSGSTGSNQCVQNVIVLTELKR